MSTVINGRELADQMQAEIQKDVEKMTQQGIQPGLVVLLVGENPASQTYVRNKERAKKLKLAFCQRSKNCQKLFQKKNYWLRLTNIIKIHAFMAFLCNYLCQNILMKKRFY